MSASGLTEAGIVVGVDGSGASDAAVRWAAHESGTRREPLIMIAAFDIESTHVHDDQRRERIYQWREREAQLALEKAQGIAQSVTDGGPVAVHCRVAFGHPAQVLIDATRNASMLVVGCRGLRSLDRMLLGSVSTAVLHHANCPVAVIHNENAVDSGAPVLLGVDGTPASEKATAIAFDEASRRDARLVAVHAWTASHYFFEPELDLDVTENEERQTLAERLAGWQEQYPEVKVERRVVCDDAAHYLIEESAQAQLVVVGSHGRGGFAGMLLGSVSLAVAQAARVPVIVARAP
ncbi:universal stress protein [Mycobacteroides saopaulense]|uniref:universal stress protein n=1 Tax=Mycobacteroides saopaulense TaxID=1578165 RepID=UPI0007228E43|nr:universal stress protein [Mycobacteroides saopaulense]ALR11757.1 universal stress protein [Mycobacteroides saopaulense]